MSRIETFHNTTFAKAALSILLALALVASGVVCSKAYAEEGSADEQGSTEAETTKSSTSAETSSKSDSSASGKEEVVYGTLSTDGKVKNIYVVNEFNLKQKGTVSDYGFYSSLTNLTSTEKISYDGEKVSVAAEKGEFFYEGVLESSDLPWDFTLEYRLDDKRVTAEELAGKSGALEISLTSMKNDAVDTTFYDNYLLQITFALDSERCADIKAADATIANSGKSKTVVYTVLPGSNADCHISTTVTDFEMSGVTIAGMPYSSSIEAPDTDEMLDDMSTLSDAISELNSGVGELASGTSTLSEGTGKLVDGSATFKEGLDTLKENAPSITQGSGKIKEALATLSDSLNSDDADSSIDLSGLMTLSEALTTTSNGLITLGDELVLLRDGYKAAYDALDSAIAGIPTDEVDWTTLYAGVSDPAATAELAKLQSYYVAGQTVRGTYYGGAQDAFIGVSTAFNSLTDETSQASIYGMAQALATMSSELKTALEAMDTSQLEKLAQGIKELSEQYGTFHDGLVKYTDGVSSAATGYATMHEGLVELKTGTQDLNGGVQELYQGTSELDEAMQSLPEEMQKQIDELMEDYLPSDFEVVSFVSSKNKAVDLVQFVILTDAIEVPEEEVEAVEEEAVPSILDQFFKLFS